MSETVRKGLRKSFLGVYRWLLSCEPRAPIFADSAHAHVFLDIHSALGIHRSRLPLRLAGGGGSAGLADNSALSIANLAKNDLRV